MLIKIKCGDKLLMRKKHPCSSDVFNVLRVGSDIRVVCEGCGRDMTFPRQTLEKMIKKVVSCTDEHEID